MDFMTEDADGGSGDEDEGSAATGGGGGSAGGAGSEQVVFLYKLVPGACPKSFGMNVARLADLPVDLVRLAAQKSREFEVRRACHGETVSRSRARSVVLGVSSPTFSL